MSNKSKLQEYCQSRAFPLPKYDTTVVGGEPHAPRWKSTVSIYSSNFVSKEFNSKKEAEQDAAGVALNYLDSMYDNMHIELDIGRLMISSTDEDYPDEVKPINNMPNDTHDTHDESFEVKHETQPTMFTVNDLKTMVFIDLENIQLTPKTMSDLSNIHDLELYGFHSSYSTVDTKKYKNLMNIKCIDSPASEAADHFMTYTIGKLVATKLINDNVKVVLLSRDKSSSVIYHILRSEKIDTIHLKSASEFELYVSSTLSK